MVLRSPTLAAQTPIRDWQVQNITLPQKAGPGQRWAPHRWQEDVYDAWVDRTIRQITGVLPSQMGKTIVCFGCALYSADMQPSPMIYVLPTEPDMVQMRAEKIDPMVESCIPLRRSARYQEAESAGRPGRKKQNADNNLMIQFGGGASLLFATAAAERSLVGKTAQRVFADEVDKYRNWERVKGNLLDRMESYAGREKLFVIGSPHGRFMMQEYELSDKRQFWVPCLECKDWQLLEWKSVIREEIAKDVYTGRLYCACCGVEVSDRMRRGMIAQGEWQAQQPEVKHHAGFHINRLYDPMATIQHICSRYSERPVLKKMFYNGTLALPYQDSEAGHVEEARWQAFFREDPPWEGCPTAITIGVDVQGDRLEYQTVLWFGGDFAFIWEHRAIMFPLRDGKPDPDPAFAALGDVFREVDPDMCLIDQSYKPEWVRDGIARHLGFYRMTNRVLGCRGMKGNTFDLPVVERASGTGPYRHWPVATDEAKMTFWDQMDRSMIYCRNTNVPAEMREQLEAEQLAWVEAPNGDFTKFWEQIRKRNEGLDCYVYALAGKRTLRLDYDRRALVAAGSRRQYPPAPQESR